MTINWQEYQNFTINQIKNAQVCWEPYWHVVLEETYHPELMQLCMDNWPDMHTDSTHKNPGGLNQNRAIYVPEHGDIVFWREFFNNIMSHPSIQNAIYGLEELEDRGNDRVTSSLWEDYPGYGVSNHVDGYTMKLGWHTYMHCDGREKWGTSLNDEHGNEIKRFPFIPNLSWLMRNDDSSWHSCDKISCNLRQSIMVRYLS